MSSLIVDVRPGERLALSDRENATAKPVTVELLRKSGQLVRLRVTAPQSVRIERESRDDDSAPGALQA